MCNVLNGLLWLTWLLNSLKSSWLIHSVHLLVIVVVHSIDISISFIIFASFIECTYKILISCSLVDIIWTLRLSIISDHISIIFNKLLWSLRWSSSLLHNSTIIYLTNRIEASSKLLLAFLSFFLARIKIFHIWIGVNILDLFIMSIFYVSIIRIMQRNTFSFLGSSKSNLTLTMIAAQIDFIIAIRMMLDLQFV